MAARSRLVRRTLLACLSAVALPALAHGASVQPVSAAVAAPHYMVIVEENQEYPSVIGSPSAPYISSLASTYASATNWFGVQLNSINDYLELISGSNQGWATPPPPPGTFTAATLVDELSANGVGWKAYMEDMPSTCYTGGDVNGYMNQHNPFMWFSSPCNNRVVPFAGNFVGDLNHGTMPPFTFVVPNRFNDMHDPSAPLNNEVLQGDQWLSTYLPQVLSSSWYASGGVVILTWDEGATTKGWNGSAGGHIPTLVISAGAHGAFSAGGNHYGTLRALEEAYGVGLLGASADLANGDLTGAVPVGTVGTRLVTQVYHDLLARAPDNGGLVYWSGLIDSGQARYPIALSLTASAEYVGQQVQALYEKYLHRATDGTLTSGGVGFWVNYIAQGATFEQLAENLIGSDEYFMNRANGDNSTYVTTLYQDILVRSPDPAGLSYWVGRLNTGDPRYLVSASILEGTEAYQKLVNSVYQTFLRHAPDAGGLTFWTGQLQAGMRDEAFIASIIGSDEYLTYALTHVL
jgi:hypothetical protein